MLLAGLGVALAAAAVGTFLLEASSMCLDVPFIDDWRFVILLQDFINHRIGWQYFFTPHNAHPFLLSRIAMVLDWRFAALDMALLRWCIVIVLLLTATLFCARLIVDLLGTKTIPRRAAASLIATPAFALTLSLGQWEILSVATCIDNAAVNLFFLLGVLSIDRWVRTNGAVFLATAILSALLCSMTVLEGILIWPALAAFLLLDCRPRHRLLSALFVVSFLGFVALTLSRLPTATFVFAPLSLLTGNLILAGSPYVGLIHNQPVLPLDIAVGALVWALTALAGMLYWRAPAELRARMNTYVVLIALGVGTSLMIEIGRLTVSMQSLAASRYITATMPWAWGLYGVLTLSMRSSYGAAAIAAMQIALVVAGATFTDYEELQIVPSRREGFLNQMRLLRDGKDLDDKSVLGNVFYMDRPNGYMVAAGRDFLFDNKLSLFRPGADDTAR